MSETKERVDAVPHAMCAGIGTHSAVEDLTCPADTA